MDREMPGMGNSCLSSSLSSTSRCQSYKTFYSRKLTNVRNKLECLSRAGLYCLLGMFVGKARALPEH